MNASAWNIGRFWNWGSSDNYWVVTGIIDIP